MSIKLTEAEFFKVMDEAELEARKIARLYFETELKGKDTKPCGFASVHIKGVRKNSTVGKLFESLGIRKCDYHKAHIVHGSSYYNGQNIDTQILACCQFASIFEKVGFNVKVVSHLD